MDNLQNNMNKLCETMKEIGLDRLKCDTTMTKEELDSCISKLLIEYPIETGPRLNTFNELDKYVKNPEGFLGTMTAHRLVCRWPEEEIMNLCGLLSIKFHETDDINYLITVMVISNALIWQSNKTPYELNIIIEQRILEIFTKELSNV